jgi:hypothetical protein
MTSMRLWQICTQFSMYLTRRVVLYAYTTLHSGTFFSTTIDIAIMTFGLTKSKHTKLWLTVV